MGIPPYQLMRSMLSLHSTLTAWGDVGLIIGTFILLVFFVGFVLIGLGIYVASSLATRRRLDRRTRI